MNRYGSVHQARRLLESSSQDDLNGFETMFDVENFDVERYLQETLKNASEEQMLALYTQLLKMHTDLKKDLEKNFYKNFREFVLISEEMQNLNKDVSKVRSLLTTLGKKIEALNLVTFEHDLTDASNTELMHRQLKRLQSSVDGLNDDFWQVPSRRVVYEQFEWKQFNVLTQKLRRFVNLVLFDDVLLVTTSSVSQERGPRKYEAQYVWNLADVEILAATQPTEDLENEQEIDAEESQSDEDTLFGKHQNLVIVKNDRKTYAFSSHGNEERDYFLRQALECKRLVSEKAQKQRELELEMHQQLLYLVRSDKNLLSTYNSFQLLYRELDSERVLSLFSKFSKTLHDLGDMIDDLDDAIALQMFNEAIKAIKQIKTYLGKINLDRLFIEFFLDKLEERVRRVTRILCHQIQYSAISRNDLRDIARLLHSLTKQSEAMEAFLQARTWQLRNKCYNVQLEKDTSDFVETSAFIAFRMLYQITESFLYTFELTAVNTEYVEWVIGQVEMFVDVVKKQYAGLVKDASYVRAVQYIIEQAKPLKEFDIDVDPILRRLQ